MKQKIKSSKIKPTIPVIILRNIIVVTIAFFIVLACQKSEGYDWVYKYLLKKNMEIIHKYKNSTIDLRYEMKLGYTYVYLRFLRDQTPDTAVILMPGAEIICSPNGKNNFSKDMANKLWATRFLYPRKIIYDKERNAQDQITHVAIINYWGYDKLPYRVDKQEENTVLPVNLSDINY